MNDVPGYFRYWGKADPAGNYHPAICHMLDVGIVARELLCVQPPQMRDRFGLLFGPAWSDTLAFISALHDIGKISPGFQIKRPDLCRWLIEKGFDFPKHAETKHGRVAACCLPPLLREEMACREDTATVMAQILAAHHGAFVGSPDVVVGRKAWDDYRRAIVRFLAGLFGVHSLDNVALPSSSDALFFAGLLTVADWLGSSELHFPLGGHSPIDVRVYMEDRRDRAKALMRELKLDSVLLTNKPFEQLFSFEANACQKAVLSVVGQLQHPMLVIAESPTGSGKTEAAQAAFSAIASQNGLRGMYCALPTQATGNAMFTRMRTFLEKLDLTGQAELHLLHANADLNPDYERLQLSHIGEPEDEVENRVIASSWFLARKRGLLASFGTGTIDQALMAILKVRHFFVRLFGLSGKVVVLDEVHAYDAYMTEEISRLIGWLSHNNSSVVLLSATLPKARREKLLSAFSPEASAPPGLRYPCVIGLDTTGKMASKEIRGLESSSVTLAPFIALQENKVRAIVQILREKLANGGCAACILNTVSEAQATYTAVREALDAKDVVLFHSRFTLERRLEIEKNILSRYGRKENRPHMGIVIATQVIEQSLDVDFDLMVSDLAPIDLLLQRAGRLHRHDNVRPPLLAERVLYVVISDILKAPDFGKSKFVYFPDILLRTALLFVKDNAYSELVVELPHGVSVPIEKVYGDKQVLSSDRFQKELERWIESRIGAEMAQRYAASAVSLDDQSSFEDDPCYFLGTLSNNEDEERIVSSRLARQNVTLIVLGKGQETAVRERADTRRLYGRSIVTDNIYLVRHFQAQEPLQAWEEDALLRRCYPLELSEGSADLGTVIVSYDEQIGLQIMRRTEAAS